MTHEYVMDRLDEWVGGELPTAERAGVDLHLAGCAECRAEAEALRALLEEVDALPTEVLPTRDLWSGIAGRLEPRGVEAAPAASATVTPIRRMPRWALQAAAAVVLMIASSALTVWVVGRDAVEQVAEGVGLPLPEQKAQNAFVAFSPAEREYQSAIGELETVLENKRHRLAPETVQTLETNLRIIDEAIRQSRAALARDPNSAEVARMLSEAYDQKLNVLHEAVSL
jgi:hypothetical protein